MGKKAYLFSTKDKIQITVKQLTLFDKVFSLKFTKRRTENETYANSLKIILVNLRVCITQYTFFKQ